MEQVREGGKAKNASQRKPAKTHGMHHLRKQSQAKSRRGSVTLWKHNINTESLASGIGSLKETPQKEKQGFNIKQLQSVRVLVTVSLTRASPQNAFEMWPCG